MIFWTWRSYFIRWQIFENKVWCPVSKKKKTVLSLFTLSCISYWQAGLGIVYCCDIVPSYWFPLLEKFEIRAFILPRNFPVVLIIFTGRGGEPPPPHSAGRGRESIPGLNVYKSDKTLHCCIKRTFLCSSAYFQQFCFWTHCDYTF